MAVPAHDERDFAFAKKMGLPILQSIKTSEDFSSVEWRQDYAADGTLTNSGEHDGISSEMARSIFAQKAESE